MREVSCSALGVVLKAAKRRGVPEAVLVEGTDHDLAYLRNTKNRIDWDAFCQILRNARSAWSLEELSELNESFLRSFFKYVGIVARLLFTSRDLFDFMLKRGVGGGPQLFSEDCIKASYEHIGAHSTLIRLVIQESYVPSPEFFWMTRGAFIAMPRAVGAGSAYVEMTIDGRSGTFLVRYKNKRGTLAALIRMLAWPFTARAAAKELKRTNEELQERFLELESARAKLDRQATLLRTAHSVNELVQRNLDLGCTLDTVTSALVEQAGFLGAEIELADGGQVARSGIADFAEVSLDRPLTARGGQPLATLRVAPRPGADREQLDELLAFVVPNLAMTLENAIYRTDLERLVEQRTGELRQAHDELARTVDQLREAQGARERFFGNISHEIRTPLAIIMVAADDILLRAGPSLEARARAGLGVITDSARKLVRLVDELLLLAAGQEGKFRMAPEPTDFVSLVAQIALAWQPAADAAGLELVTRAPASLVVNVDPTAIERVITNLVSNAVKHTPRGGRVELELAEDPLGVSVLDTGPGIDAELTSRLFGRFERGGHKTGTGIGLSLTKQLVEAHGGSIVALPRSGGGAELRVLLPPSLLVRGVQPAPVTLRLVEEPDEAPPPPMGGTTLAPAGIARDTRLAEMIARLLAVEYTVVIAHDGLSALELVAQHRPQLLITDVDMPGLDGIELARRFREQSVDQLAPIIILSAMLDLGTRVAGLEAGAVDYVAKPFDPRELEARVHAQFRMRDLALRLHRAEQLSALGILTSGLAHELRNPANGIVNAIYPLTELLPAELKHPDHPIGQLVEVVAGCADQINFLAHQLLGFRNESGELVKRSVALRELVRTVVGSSQSVLSQIDVRIELDDIIVSCAPPLITQVLKNLIENAAHAAGLGGWIALRGHVREDTLVLEVADSGPGVPAPLRERVFEPFFTTKPPGIGTGLGLSLARDIVHRHRGVLEIRERGPQTIFVIELPGAHSAPGVTATAV
jgi:signal transduction histidine kinase